MATPVQLETMVKIPEQKLNPQAPLFIDKKEQGVATTDYLENDLEKISVDIFHSINEHSEKVTHNAQIYIENDSNEIYIENCKKIDITEQTIEKVTSFKISLLWWLMMIIIMIIGKYIHFDISDYLLIGMIMGFIFT